MLDLTLFVLVSDINKIFNFLKIGFKSNKFKFKIVFLSNEPRPSVLPEAFNWVGFSGSSSTRFIEYILKNEIESRWAFQVGDDSCTDIDSTIQRLDYFYNYEDPIVITGSSSFFYNLPRYIDRTSLRILLSKNEISEGLQNVIKKMDLFVGTNDLNKFKTIPYFASGCEHVVLSKFAWDKIRNYERANDYLNNCSEESSIVDDEVIYLLARIAKVPVTECYFLSPNPNFESYTGLIENARFTHIGNIANCDQLEELLIESKEFEDPKEIIEIFEQKFEDSLWVFYAKDESKINSRCILKLNKNGFVEVVDTIVSNINFNFENYNFNDKKWIFENGITFEDSNDQKIKFSKKQENLYFYDNLILSKFHIMDMISLRQDFLFGNFDQRFC